MQKKPPKKNQKQKTQVSFFHFFFYLEKLALVDAIQVFIANKSCLLKWHLSSPDLY